VERGVPRPVNLAAGERLCQHLDQLGGQLHLGGGALAAPEPEQDRQPGRNLATWAYAPQLAVGLVPRLAPGRCRAARGAMIFGLWA